MEYQDVEQAETTPLPIQNLGGRPNMTAPQPPQQQQQQAGSPMQIPPPMYPGHPHAATISAVHPGGVNQIVVNSVWGNRKQTNHVLHAVLTVLSGGLWSPIWLLVWAQNESHNRKVGY